MVVTAAVDGGGSEVLGGGTELDAHRRRQGIERPVAAERARTRTGQVEKVVVVPLEGALPLHFNSTDQYIANVYSMSPTATRTCCLPSML